MSGRLAVHQQGPVATIVIDHPAKRNAMTADMWRALPPLLASLEADPLVRVVVLTGAGETFCAGADIANLAAIGTETAGANLAVAAEEALAGFAKPTIAAIQGDCIGGGCQLALACDIRLAAPETRFGITPAKLGVIYPMTSIRRLVRVAGVGAAQWLLLSAELVSVERAYELHLVHEVVAELGERTATVASILASRSLLSQVAMKEMIADTDLEPLRVEQWMAQVRESGEAAEGAAAFLARRPPSFPWRYQREPR